MNEIIGKKGKVEKRERERGREGERKQSTVSTHFNGILFLVGGSREMVKEERPGAERVMVRAEIMREGCT